MELLFRLMDELGVTREQAEGAAGALLQLAQARIAPQDFVQVADAIPGISDVIAKSPRYTVSTGGEWRTALSRLLGGLGGLGPVAEPFARLRLDKRMAPRVAQELERIFAEKGGLDVQVLLSTAWR
jgi:hypothetical protein